MSLPLPERAKFLNPIRETAFTSNERPIVAITVAIIVHRRRILIRFNELTAIAIMTRRGFNFRLFESHVTLFFEVSQETCILYNVLIARERYDLKNGEMVIFLSFAIRFNFSKFISNYYNVRMLIVTL